MAMHCYAEYGTPDHFLIDCNMNINVQEIAGKSELPVLMKIVNNMGQEIPFKPNTPLLYFYNDGSVERKMIIK